MEKQYFVKFLPDNSKIKKGDYIFWRDEGRALPVHEVNDINLLYDLPGQHDHSEYGVATFDEVIKVKMNLCKEFDKATLPEDKIVFWYSNWKRKVELRRVRVIKFWEGTTKFHEEKQWFLKAFDFDRNEERDFAVKDMFIQIAGISTDAGWVKDGDRFSLNDIYHSNPETDPEGWDKENYGEVIVFGRLSNPPNTFVRIKGPCGHFH